MFLTTYGVNWQPQNILIKKVIPVKRGKFILNSRGERARYQVKLNILSRRAKAKAFA